MPIEVRPATPADAAYVTQSLTTAFHGTLVAVHDELINAAALPAAIAWQSTTPAGLLTYRPTDVGWEVVSLAADQPGSGAGTALLAWLREAAIKGGAQRIWLVTTNDNTGALRFYQRYGFDLVAIHRDAVTRARTLKPAIPLESDGIPLRHEIELELRLKKP